LGAAAGFLVIPNTIQIPAEIIEFSVLPLSAIFHIARLRTELIETERERGKSGMEAAIDERKFDLPEDASNELFMFLSPLSSPLFLSPPECRIERR